MNPTNCVTMISGPGVDLGHAKPIQHLANAEPAIMANGLLRHIGQHRIGTAKCHHRNLAEEQALLP